MGMSEIRTPPSLKWLLDRRARLLGEIERQKQAIKVLKAQKAADIAQLEQSLANLKAEQKRKLRDEDVLRLLEQDLRAIDGTLRQHDIQIDLSLVRPVRSHKAVRYLGHGKMTRYVFELLGAIYPESASASEVAAYISAKEQLSFTDHSLADLRECVRQRMKNLSAQGKLFALHAPKTQLEGRWRLHSVMQPDQIKALLADDSLASSPSTIETDHY